MTSTLSPSALLEMVLGDAEYALIDVREQGSFADAHLLFAVNVPLSRLELMVGALIPRHDVPIILVDDPKVERFADQAGKVLTGMGYRHVQVLEGGIDGWREAGGELFSGINVPSKAFGEFVEHTYDTPRMDAAEIKDMLDRGRNMVVVDSRPYAEYHRMNIPGATDVPGAELVYRIHDLAPDPATLVVVNCAGRTRSIIGAQSLINAGVPNDVVALKDGTMGWHLAGFALEHGATRSATLPSAEALETAIACSDRVAERFGVSTISAGEAHAWCADSTRTTYLLDVRSPEEFAAAHLSGSRNAPGGQLVQATDEYVAVKNARLVLIDHAIVRATMTASWLIQMGWRDVRVLDPDGEWDVTWATQLQPQRAPSYAVSDAPGIATHELEAMLDEACVIDLSPSPVFERSHIPGAIWTVRARLRGAAEACQPQQTLVLTSTDGNLANLAAADARTVRAEPVLVLAEGNKRWIEEGRNTAAGLADTFGPLDDVWYKPYDHRDQQEAFMRSYLTWEVALVEQIERDGTTRFRRFD